MLRLSHSTLSGQIHALEDRLGEKLFARAGRKLQLTEMGRVVYRYAEEIFALGNEMLDTVKGRPTGLPGRLTVGIADVVPKRVVHRLLQPALEHAEEVNSMQTISQKLYARLLTTFTMSSSTPIASTRLPSEVMRLSVSHPMPSAYV